MSYRDEEPEAHCYECPNALHGDCAEFNALNPLYTGGYDRKFCRWGAKTIKQVRLEHAPMLKHAEAIRLHLLKRNVTYEELLLVKQHAIELRREVDEALSKLVK